MLPLALLLLLVWNYFFCSSRDGADVVRKQVKRRPSISAPLSDNVIIASFSVVVHGWHV